MGTHDGRGCPRSDEIATALGLTSIPDLPPVHKGRSWHRDGVAGEELSWSVDDGHATRAWLLRPDGVAGDLPGILLLHAHDGVKFYGKEKVADGPDGIAPGVADLRKRGYDGMCVADGLVRAGFAVLVHDVFGWGSRRVPWDRLPDRALAAGWAAVPEASDVTDAASERRRRYDAAAREHEHGLAKIAALTGSSLAGRALREDLVALAVLRSTAGVDPHRVATTGFSGGGARACHLLACAVPGALRAAVVTASMSTFADVADGHADDTSWWIITPGLPAVCDWPDVASAGAPTPLLTQFAQFDGHFGLDGMRRAERALQTAYAGSGRLTTSWHPEPHRFSSAMQEEAVRWLVDCVVPHALDRGL